MKNKKILKLALLLALASVLIATFSAKAAAPLQLDYPQVQGEKALTTGKTPLLPQYLRYIFTLIIVFAGIVILGVIIWAGFSYVMSAGNAGVMTESRSRIVAGFVGMFILLASYLLLNAISPSLTKIKFGTITTGTVVMNANEDRLLVASYVEDFTHAGTQDGAFKPTKIIIPPEYKDHIEIFFFTEPYFKGETMAGDNSKWVCLEEKIDADSINNNPNARPKYIECSMDFPQGYSQGSMIANWLRPGVYVYKVLNNGRIPFYVGGPQTNLTNVTEFSDIGGEIKGLRVYNGDDPRVRWSAMVFFEEAFEGKGAIYMPQYKAGWATDQIVALSLIDSSAIAISETKQIKSIKPFQIKNSGNPTVEVFRAPEFAETEKCNLKEVPGPAGKAYSVWEGDAKCPRDAQSLRISGGNAIAFDAADDNKFDISKDVNYFLHAEYFDHSDPNLNDNEEIGRCVCNRVFVLWCSVWWSCVSHVLPFAVP